MGASCQGGRAIKIFRRKFIVITLFLILILLNLLSFYLATVVSGDARVMNYTGIVRGATQRLVKMELMGRRNDGLLAEIDEIIDELISGRGPHGLDPFDDDAFRERMGELQGQWNRLKDAIGDERRTGSFDDLFALSETFFETANSVVFLAEQLSGQRTDRILSLKVVLIAVSGILAVVFLLHTVEARRLYKRNRFLAEKAMVDQMTTLPNRWSCDLQVKKYREIARLPDLMCFVVDLNNLKSVNDTLGHEAGDRLIASFARILMEVAEPYGFVGRNGGDEFLGLFENFDREKAGRFYGELCEGVNRHNEACGNFKISFAYGAALSCEMETASIFNLMRIADQRMYADKIDAKRGNPVSVEISGSGSKADQPKENGDQKQQGGHPYPDRGPDES